MKKISFYDKKFLFGIRCFAIICLIFLTGIEAYNRVKRPLYFEGSIDFNSLFMLIQNTSVIIFAYLLALFPYKLELLAIPAFIYAFSCNIMEKHNPMGICMYFLGISLLYLRGFFIKHKKPKIIIFLIICFLLIIGEFYLYNTISDYLNSIIDKLGYSLVLSIISFLLISYKNTTFNSDSNQTPKKLNLAEFPGLVINDIPLLQNVLQDKQYKEIAINVKKAEGTVRNRLNKIYDLLGVMDKMGFITNYLGYEIVFCPVQNEEIDY